MEKNKKLKNSDHGTGDHMAPFLNRDLRDAGFKKRGVSAITKRIAKIPR
jgi:hypothetical protein